MNIQEDTTTSIPAQVSDADSGTLTVTFTANQGVFNVSLPQSGVTVAGLGTGNMSLTGAPANINTALSTFTYRAANNYNGPDTLTMSTTDGGLTDVDTCALTVVAVNDNPINTVPAGIQTTPEDTAKLITGVSVADDSATLTTTLTVGNGTLSVTTSGGGTFTGNSTANVSVSGTPTQVNAALAGLTYHPRADFHGTAVLQIVTSDGTLSDTDTISLQVTGVSDVVNDSVTTEANTAVSFNVLANDTFSDPARQVTSVTQPANGAVTFQSNGACVFTPNAGFSGTTSFTYTVIAFGNPETGTVNITVNAAGGGGALPGDIVDAAGVVDNTAYDNMAFQYNQANGITYRYGPAATKTGVSEMPLRPDNGFIQYGNYQLFHALGTENNNLPNLYVSMHGAIVGYPTGTANVNNAVAWLQTDATERITWMQRPQKLWQDNVERPPALDTYIAGQQYGGLTLSATDEADVPNCSYRGENAADSASSRLSLVATRGSATRAARMFTIGTYTAQNRGMCIFDLGFVPTDICGTGGGEFAFVTGWDTVNHVGKVAVVACASACQGCVVGGPQYDWWHDWMDHIHPGIQNQGNYVFLKVIGYITLPSTMKAPTACRATTGVHPYAGVIFPPGGISYFTKEASPLQDNRATMQPGGQYYEMYSKGACLAVTSKSEKMVAFYDLGPLWRYFLSMYLDSEANNAETRNYGLAANQWPYLMVDRPQMIPTLIKTIQLPNKPTGLWMTSTRSYWSKDDRIHIPPESPFWTTTPHYSNCAVGTENGDVYVYSMGRYVAGVKPTLGEGGGPVPGDVVQVGFASSASLLGAGGTFTHFAGAKFYRNNDGSAPEDDPLNNMILFTDRPNRRWGWLRLVTDNGNVPATSQNVTISVFRTMEDSRCDPVMVTANDNYSTIGNHLVMADWTANMTRAYRAGPVIYEQDLSAGWCNNTSACPTMGPNGEYCGGYTHAFKPFSVGSANTP